MSRYIKVILLALFVGFSQTAYAQLKLSPENPTAADELEAICELYDKQGDTYRQGRIVARNKVNHFVKCALTCEGMAGNDQPFRMYCEVQLQPNQSTLCGGNTQSGYKFIVTAKYKCGL